MNDSKSYLDTLREAMAKKHAAEHPDAKQTKNKGKGPGPGAANAPKGPPVRRGASRGG